MPHGIGTGHGYGVDFYRKRSFGRGGGQHDYRLLQRAGKLLISIPFLARVLDVMSLLFAFRCRNRTDILRGCVDRV